MRGWNRRAVVVAATLTGWAAALWVLWGPMAHSALEGRASTCVKAFYLPDQFSVMAIARNVADGRPAYVEPFTATGSSVYPSGYYWLMGHASEAAGTTVLGAWNALGLLASLLLLAVCAAWARWARPGTLAWLLAPLPVLAGSLQWWGGGGWSADLGGPVVWPAAASLYSPGAETPALVCAALALLGLAAALAGGRRRLLAAAGAGAAAGLTLHLHAYVATFTGVALVSMLLVEALAEGPVDRRWRRIAAAGVAALLAVLVLAPDGGFGTRLGAIVVVVAVILAADRRWRHRAAPVAALLGGTALLVAAPLGTRIVAQMLDPGSFYRLREASVSAVSLEPPPGPLLLVLLPVWLLTGAALVHLSRGARGDARQRAWFAALAGVTVAVVLLTYNRRLGVEGLESYRFVPYGAVLCVMLASPWLWSAVVAGARRERAVAVGTCTVLAAGLPTIAVFAHAQWNALRCFMPEERTAYREVARAIGPQPLVLLDRCLVPYELKVLSGLRVVNVNPGLAVPDRFAQVRAALRAVAVGHGPAAARNADPGVLPDLGATRFLTRTGCNGVGDALLRRRFGAPIARIPLRSPSRYGLPDPTRFDVYRIPRSGRI